MNFADKLFKDVELLKFIKFSQKFAKKCQI